MPSLPALIIITEQDTDGNEVINQRSAKISPLTDKERVLLIYTQCGDKDVANAATRFLAWVVGDCCVYQDWQEDLDDLSSEVYISYGIHLSITMDDIKVIKEKNEWKDIGDDDVDTNTYLETYKMSI